VIYSRARRILMTDAPTSNKESQVPTSQEPAPVPTPAPEPSNNPSDDDPVGNYEHPRPILVTETELHYRSLTEYFRSLTEYFKYVVKITFTGITILVAVALYITNKDLSAMRAEVRQNVLDAKAEIRQNMSDIKADTRTAVDSTREDARTSIDNATSATNTQIHKSVSEPALSHFPKLSEESMKHFATATSKAWLRTRPVGRSLPLLSDS